MLLCTGMQWTPPLKYRYNCTCPGLHLLIREAAKLHLHAWLPPDGAVWLAEICKGMVGGLLPESGCSCSEDPLHSL